MGLLHCCVLLLLRRRGSVLCRIVEGILIPAVVIHPSNKSNENSKTSAAGVSFDAQFSQIDHNTIIETHLAQNWWYHTSIASKNHFHGMHSFRIMQQSLPPGCSPILLTLFLKKEKKLFFLMKKTFPVLRFNA